MPFHTECRSKDHELMLRSHLVSDALEGIAACTGGRR